MTIKNLVSLMMASLFLTSCFVTDTSKSKNKKLVSESSELIFPLADEDEERELEIMKRQKCVANPDCAMNDRERFVDDFVFRSGKLILRGNLAFWDESRNTWFINDNLTVTSFARNPEILQKNKESEFHEYSGEMRPYRQLSPGINMNMHLPVRPIIVTQGKLGLKELTRRDPGMCDIFAAENFLRLSNPPWPKYDFDKDNALEYKWPKGTGMFNEDNDLFAGETLVICGEINILNRTLKLEAKNIIFYNSHIRVMSDRDMGSGLRITAENIGYFGTNMIESNIINTATGQKNSTAPTIEIGASGIVSKVESSAPVNNLANAHYLHIFMGEHTVVREFTEKQ